MIHWLRRISWRHAIGAAASGAIVIGASADQFLPLLGAKGQVVAGALGFVVSLLTVAAKALGVPPKPLPPTP